MPRRIFSLPKFQFSLAWLMIAVTVVALALALAHLVGDFLGLMLFAAVCCILPTPLVICAIFARGDLQAFAIGALIPWFTLYTWMSNSGSLSIAVWLVFLPAICGALAVATRRWIERHDGK
jgi:hypothetical protein